MVRESTTARTPTPIPPPTTTRTEPPVTAIAFAVISDRVSTKRGRPAESAARIKRFIPNAIRTTIVKAKPVVPRNIKKATTKRFRVRARFEMSKARCLETRSRTVPTKGPTIEYGSKTTAKPRAALNALAWRSGEKRTKDARALWKMPSVACPVQRIASKRENLGCVSR